ncbi:Sec-independent protein translocase subunit TatA [Streptomyces sp. NBC_01310]|uniref:Sec-independent protein translocase subunit TatA n=1 Tax=unclassified Streptomyces TaxID=2593676 RepID=UPI002DD7A5C5|nr:Sec-independent protein translocase subunit TatA [Streptomyces sp. NBC_01294]WRZ60238.1 Sec-independent protein translocase subunit TatA [Streptomyces sp. NBC_01294]WSJ58150.1 Sec-independent protein translocase subunit TatA [Streptomyces sp. NBC_01310]
MGNLRGWEILVIVGVIILLFGAKKLPDMARSLGKSARILKSEAKAMKKDGEAEDAATATVADQAGQQPVAPRTIQAAPGDVTSARPVSETNRTAQG